MRLVTSFFVVLTSILRLAAVRKERAEKWIAEGAVRVVHGILLFPVVLQAQWPDCRGKKKLLSMVRYHEPPDTTMMSALFPEAKSVPPIAPLWIRFIFPFLRRRFILVTCSSEPSRTDRFGERELDILHHSWGYLDDLETWMIVQLEELSWESFGKMEWNFFFFVVLHFTS